MQPATTGCVADEPCITHKEPEAHSMQHATTRSVRNATCNNDVNHAECNMQHAACDMYDTTMQYAAFNSIV
jgi:hypothetical protein